MSPLTELYSSATDVKEGMFQAHSPDLGEESSSFLLLDSKKDLDTGESVLGSEFGKGEIYWDTPG